MHELTTLPHPSRKCHCFVGGTASNSSGEAGGGGCAGIASVPGRKFERGSSVPGALGEADDVSLDNFFADESKQFPAAVAFYEDLGVKCCQVAMGVDIFGLVSSSAMEAPQSVMASLYVPLNLRSGGSTQVADMACYDGSISPLDIEGALPGTPAFLMKTCLSKTAWWRPTSFGGGLRIRTSPTFNIVAKSKSMYQSGGISGAVSSDPVDQTLYYIGTCDDNATIAFDLELNPGLSGTLDVEGYEGGGERRALHACGRLQFFRAQQRRTACEAATLLTLVG